VISVTFSEAVSGLTDSDFVVENGAVSNTTSTDGISWTALLTPSVDIEDTSNAISLPATVVVDARGNANSVGSGATNYSLDTKRPEVLSIAFGKTALKGAADSTTVTVTFSESVSGLTASDFVYDTTNTTLSDFTAVTASGGTVWTASLTVNSNLNDSTNTLTLSAGAVTDANGNTNIAAPSGTSGNVTIDADTQSAWTDFIAGTVTIDGGAATSKLTVTGVPNGATLRDNDNVFDDIRGVEQIVYQASSGTVDLTMSLNAERAGIRDITLTGTYSASIMHVEGYNNGVKLETGNGEDSIYGSFYADTLIAGGGNDYVFDGGGQANDLIDAGSGDNTIESGDGNQTILAGNGADKITAGSGDDSIVSNDGNDTIFAGAGNDVIRAGAGTDNIDAGANNDTIYGAQGSDVIQGNDGTDVLVIDGNYRADSDSNLVGVEKVLVQDNATPVLVDLSNQNTNEGFTVQLSDRGDTVILSADTLSVMSNDIVIGGNGNDSIVAGAGTDSVDAGAGDDTVVAGNGDALLAGGQGNDLLAFRENFSDSADTQVTGFERFGVQVSGLTIDLSHQSDNLVVDLSQVENTNLSLGSGHDSVLSGAGSDTIAAGAGNDTLVGGQGNDLLLGEDGNDSLVGGADNDSLYGGNGDDVIQGNAGADFVDAGDGNDIIHGESADTTIQGGNGQDTLHLVGSYDDNNNNSKLDGVENVVLDASGLTLDLSAQTDSFSIVGTNGQDRFDLGTGNDTVVADAGDDSVVAAGGNKTLSMGLGNDTIVMGGTLSAGDTIDAGGDNDWLSFTDVSSATTELNHVTNVENIVLGDATTTITAVDGLVGSGQTLNVSFAGSTTNALIWDGTAETDGTFNITSGNGNDSIIGGTGNDSIVTAGGDDTVLTNGGSDWISTGLGNDSVSNAGTFNDTVSLGDGNDVFNSSGGNDSVLLGEGNDIVNFLSGSLNSGDTVLGGGGADLLNYTDASPTLGTELNNVQGIETITLNNAATYVVTQQSLVDSTATLTVFFNNTDAGNTLYWDGSAETDGGRFNITSDGGSAQATIYGGSSSDTITTGSGNDRVFTNGGGDSVSTGNGHDLVTDSGSGNDTVRLGAGNDTFLGAGGNDSVDLSTGADRIEMGTNLTVGDTVAGGSELGDVLTYTDNNGTGVGNELDNVTGIDTVVLGDATTYVVTQDSLVANGLTLTVDATALSGGNSLFWNGAAESNGSFYVTASDGNNTIAGGAMADLIISGNGNDSIAGGQGANTLYAQNGHNTVTAGSGNDTIVSGTGNDSIVAGDGDNLITGGAGQNVVSSGSGDDNIGTGDGDDWVAAGAGNNLIDVAAGNNTVTALGGHDFVTSGDGNDLIDVGDGNNTVLAGGGHNTVTGGAHNDVITAGNGNDSITAGAGDNTITAGDGHNTVTGLSGIDIVTAGSGNDLIDVGAGNNIVAAGDGNNTVTGLGGDDSVTAGSGNDLIDVGAGVNTVYAGSGNDTISAAGGNDFVDAGNGNDSISSGAGDDTILAGDGNDTIFGGAGKDWITLGTGADRVVYTDSTQSLASNYDVVNGFDFWTGDTFVLPQRSLTMKITDNVIGTGSVRWYADNSTLGLVLEGISELNQALSNNQTDGAFVYIAAGSAQGLYMIFNSGGLWSGYQKAEDLVVKLDGYNLPFTFNAPQKVGETTWNGLVGDVVNFSRAETALTVYSASGQFDGTLSSLVGSSQTPDPLTAQTISQAYTSGVRIIRGGWRTIDTFDASGESSFVTFDFRPTNPNPLPNTSGTTGSMVGSVVYQYFDIFKAGAQGSNVTLSMGHEAVYGGSGLDTVRIDTLNLSGEMSGIDTIEAFGDNSLVGLNRGLGANLANTTLVIRDNGSTQTMTESEHENLDIIGIDTNGGVNNDDTVRISGGENGGTINIQHIHTDADVERYVLMNDTADNGITVTLRSPVNNSVTIESNQSSDTITINAGALDANDTLYLVGSADFYISGLTADLDARGLTSESTLIINTGDAGDNQIHISTGTATSTINSSAPSDTIYVDAEELIDGQVLNLTGSSAFIVTNLLGDLNNTATGAVNVTLDRDHASAPSVDVSITTATALTIENGALIDEDQILVQGTGNVTVTGLVADLNASNLTGGTLDVTTGDNQGEIDGLNQIDITTGLLDTSIHGTASGDTVQVDAEALVDDNTLTTSGASNFQVTNLLGDMLNTATGSVEVWLDDDTIAGATSTITNNAAITLVLHNDFSNDDVITTAGSGSFSVIGLKADLVNTATGSVTVTLEGTNAVDEVLITNATSSGANFDVFNDPGVSDTYTGFGNNDRISLAGVGQIDVFRLVADLNATDLTGGTLDITTADNTVDNGIAISTGDQATSITGTAASDTITVDARALDNGNILTVDGQSKQVVNAITGDLDARGLTGGTLDVTTDDNLVDNTIAISTGSLAATVTGVGGDDTIGIVADQLGQNTVMTLSGVSEVTVSGLVGDINAAQLTDGTLDVSTGNAGDNGIAITTGDKATSITGTAANDTVSVDATALDNNTSLTLSGQSTQVVTALTGDVNASGLTGGTLDITTADNTVDNGMAISTGALATSVTGTAAGDTVTINATTLGQNTVLTLDGNSNMVVTALVGNVNATDLSGGTLVVTTGNALDNGITVSTGQLATTVNAPRSATRSRSTPKR